MKGLVSVLLTLCCATAVIAGHNQFNHGIFLHHSTGGILWGLGGGPVTVPDEIIKYDSTHALADSAAFAIEERFWPDAPDNEWARWHRIFANADSGSDIRPILNEFSFIVIKSCFPSSQLTGIGTPADTLTPDDKTIYNYKWHLRFIVRTMMTHPTTFFVIWTNAPLAPAVTNDLEASLSNQFCTWMKDTLAAGRDSVFGAFPKNVYIFDLFHKLAGADGRLQKKYMGTDTLDSHPRGQATIDIAPVWVKEMFDAVLSRYYPSMPAVGRTSIEFGETAKGDSAEAALSVVNRALTPLTLRSFSTVTRNFTWSVAASETVKALDSLSIRVRFRPTAFGDVTDTLTISSDSGRVHIALHGISPSPQIVLSAAAIDFGTVKRAQTGIRECLVTNTAINTLAVDSIRTRTAVFKVIGSAAGFTVTKKDTLVIKIGFTPDSVRQFSDTLLVYSNAGTHITKITLTGLGEKVTGVARDDASLPTTFMLSQNYPNPFNPSTTIRFDLAERSHVSLVVYDVTGRVVSVLTEGEMPPGTFTAVFDASRLSSGMYYYRLQAVHGASVFTDTRKLLLLK